MISKLRETRKCAHHVSADSLAEVICRRSLKRPPLHSSLARSATSSRLLPDCTLSKGTQTSPFVPLSRACAVLRCAVTATQTSAPNGRNALLAWLSISGNFRSFDLRHLRLRLPLSECPPVLTLSVLDSSRIYQNLSISYHPKAKDRLETICRISSNQAFVPAAQARTCSLPVLSRD